ncbi:hypothetical protein E2562_009694, partial [Oryza meyeriana var. granulata]
WFTVGIGKPKLPLLTGLWLRTGCLPPVFEILVQPHDHHPTATGSDGSWGKPVGAETGEKNRLLPPSGCAQLSALTPTRAGDA